MCDAKDVDVSAAIESVKRHIITTGKTQSAVATELGVSKGLLSAFLSNKYATPLEIIPKIDALLKVAAKKEMLPEDPPFAMTSISRKITSVIEYCHYQGKIGVAYGDAGIGKTMTASQYARDNPDAVMITVAPCYATISGVTELLAERLKIKQNVSRKTFGEIINRLAGTNKVILIDEAQHLTSKAINHLRSIPDGVLAKTGRGIGMAFIGNDEIYFSMRGNAYAQIYSRIGIRRRLETTQIQPSDIRAVFAQAELDKDSVDILHAISRTSYGIRGAVNVYVNTLIACRIKHSGELTADLLGQMARDMNIA